MLTKITIRNFKMLENMEVPLGNSFVFVGANNSGKTSALQALALWHIGLQKYNEKKRTSSARVRAGVAINRLDLIPLPISQANFIWFNRKVRANPNSNIRIELIVEGFSHGDKWECGLEFDYSNPEAFHCRPLRLNDDGNERMEIPEEALKTKIAFLPPMSGLVTEEAIIQGGRINVLIGEGRTAEVLRNLCYLVHERDKKDWKILVHHINDLFGVALQEPIYSSERGSVGIHYLDRNNVSFELSSAGRGLQQVLLLLAYLYTNDTHTIFLLDEPDAHLEILRQRQIYNLMSAIAEERNAQIISASHSEVLLDEAAQREAVVSFTGRKPHLLGENAKSHVMRALREIGYSYYQNIENKGWILYLEGESDLKILHAFAKKFNHEAENILSDPLIKYINNDVGAAKRHFEGLRDAKEDARGFLLVDNLPKGLGEKVEGLVKFMWHKNEIENYLCHREAIIGYVTQGLDKSDLFQGHEASEREKLIIQEMDELERASKVMDAPLPFSDDIKASKFLKLLFKSFSKALKNAPVFLRKSDFYKLVEYIPQEKIDKEVIKVLDGIVKLARSSLK